MNLPERLDDLSNTFPKLTAERKRQILEQLKNTGGDRLQSVVGQIVENGGPEGEFMTHIFGKDVPDRGAAPLNKKLNPPHVK